jgi:hypothetical protein
VTEPAPSATLLSCRAHAFAPSAALVAALARALSPSATADLPAALAHFEDLNAKLARQAGWKPITQAKAPLPEHAQWKDRTDKLPLLQMPPA